MLNKLYLSWIDYVLLVLFLALSAGIGIWHGCFGTKQATTKDFLMAGGKMSMLPTAISLFATICSASTMLGIPVEIYYYGTLYLYFSLAWFIAIFPTHFIFIPKFRELNFVSVYEYLEKRFSLALRISVTLVYVLSLILFMSAILYGPCLALSQVTGLDMWLAIISCGAICTFYTSIGGMKAVIWTDVLQSCVMFAGVVLSIVYGFIDTGGIKRVFEIANAGQRMNFHDTNFDLNSRYTIWVMVFSGTLYATAASCVLQTQTQRYMCVKTTREAQKALWINNLMCILLISLCGIVGLLVYAKYHDCDPLQAKLVARPDQFYPLFVIQTFNRFPGLTGLFIACIMSGSLSSISSGVNSIAAVVIEDIWKRLLPNRTMSDRVQAKVSKYLSVGLGLLTILLAFFISYLPNILVIVYSTMGTLLPPIFGVFLLGFFVPRVNSRSALIAFLAALAFQLWVAIGAYLTRHQQIKRTLPVSIDGCAALGLTNVTISTASIRSDNGNNFLLPLYSISFMWYSLNGVILTIIVGLVCALFCGNSKSDVEKIDPTLLITCRQIFRSKEKNISDSEEIPFDDRTIKTNGTKNAHVDGASPEEKELMAALSTEA